MVLGAAPCSAARRKCRKPAYLGLLPAPEGGVSDITEMYVQRYGEPKAGERVFIRTRQQTNGWEGWDKDVNDLVPVSQGGTAARRRGCGGMLVGLNELHGLNGLHELQEDTVTRGRGRGRHQACPREQRRSSTVVARLQCRWGRGCARGRAGQIRRPKLEIRRKSEIRSPNAAWPGGLRRSPGRLVHQGCPREQRRSGEGGGACSLAQLIHGIAEMT